MGDLLRVDLTTRTSSEETLPAQLIRDYIGGKGIGTHLLLEEVAPDVEPLSPRNKLIFVNGPLAGTRMWGSDRYSLFFLSPQTGGYGECYAGGSLAPQFAATGFKVIILEGASEPPVYLEISEDGVMFHPADDVWGLDAFESEDLLLAKTGVEGAQACVIGPAGENLVRFACINNNKWHCLGRGGPGAVMGAKKVKGIVFHGSRRTPVARPDEFKALAKEMLERSKTDPGVATLHHAGTVNVVRIANGTELFPTRYWRSGHVDGWEGKLTIDVLRERFDVTKATCPPCFIRCINHTRVTEGPYAGLEVEGPEYETVFSFGGLCEIDDLVEIVRLNDLCDRYGVDSISAGNLCGLAIEASRRGAIDLDLDYGDADGVAEFLGMTVGREGVGDVFADGILRAEKELGLEGVAVHVKGMEPSGYDPRVSKGMALGYITTSRGACHLRATFFRAEVQGVIDFDAVEGKAAMYVDFEDRYCLMDSLIFCRFYRDYVEWPDMVRVVNATLGTDYSVDDLHCVANRIITESHEFNRRRGFGVDQERLPRWLMENPQEGPQQATITPEQVEALRRDYYAARGWSLS